MKSLLVLFLAMVSFSSFAHGIKRLTTTTCTSEDAKSSVLAKWDSSITPLGPVLLKINGEEVFIIEEIASDFINFSGKLRSNEEFAVTLRGDKKFQTILNIADEKTVLNCETSTKFRLY
jgi:hypothetical protein